MQRSVTYVPGASIGVNQCSGRGEGRGLIWEELGVVDWMFLREC